MKLNLFYTLALEASVEAGIAIKKIYQSKKYDVELKADDSPVTLADKTSSAIIAEYLKKTPFPVIDEEKGLPDYSIRKGWKNLWLVDPMDGTREFISGNGEFTVNIALVEKGSPVFGVIYAPTTGCLYWGGKDTGSFKLENLTEWPGIENIEKRATLLQPQPYNGKLRIAASRSHLDEATKSTIAFLQNKYGEIEYLTKGSSLKLCMIAEGSTDFYPRFSRTMEWDTAAGHAIAAGTGGILLQADTRQEMVYNKEDLANPRFYALSGMQLKKGLLIN
jgi:3'(2'), 5'-bisphosphate nucleotidase